MTKFYDDVQQVVGVGELAGAVTATQLPDLDCGMAMFKAVASNDGNVYLGLSTVTVVDGTTDITTGFELTPGDATPWIPLQNLNVLYRICDNAGDDLTYIAVK